VAVIECERCGATVDLGDGVPSAIQRQNGTVLYLSGRPLAVVHECGAPSTVSGNAEPSD
jgi:hypothetical protein